MASVIQFVDETQVFTGAGRVTGYDIYTGRAGTQRIQIWRPDPNGVENRYVLLCENVITAGTAAAPCGPSLD